MLDRSRILAKLDQIDGYLNELQAIAPSTFDAFVESRTKRACERLLQISVEAALDVSALLVSGLRLGLPGEEDDFFDKLQRGGVLSAELVKTLRQMRGFRNILVHECGEIADQLVFELLNTRVQDFRALKAEVLRALGREV